MRYEDLTKTLIKKLYYIDKLSIQKISDKLQISHNVINRFMNNNNLIRRQKSCPKYYYLKRKEIFNIYKNNTMFNTAKQLNISVKTLGIYMRKFNIKRKNRREYGLNKIPFKKQLLKELYKTLSIKQIANQLNVPDEKIDYYFDRYKIKRRTSWQTRRLTGDIHYIKNPNINSKKFITKEEIEKLYYEDKISLEKIADILRISFKKLKYWVNKYDIKYRKDLKENAAAWKGGKYISGDNKYMIYMPEHPRAGYNGYIPEHILVMEKKLGRHLNKSEIVHHKNKNGLDNRDENLELCLSQAEHMRKEWSKNE